mmetsp:Transcript_42335/g.68654  ORF Transcript_42335/g.68654 Transcript_42335/m.68654 type:complete len:566 (-) Transcript_42335:123-1820(-)
MDSIDSIAKRCWKCNGRRMIFRERAEITCTVCNGVGALSRQQKSGKKHGKKYKEFSPPGPLPNGSERFTEVLDAEDEELSLDRLTGHFRIYQSDEHHKYSTDDVVTAFCAYSAGRFFKQGRIDRILDLGCGLGSVLISNAWLHSNASQCIGIEAQPSRARLAKRSVRYNFGDQSRVLVMEGDIRDPQIFTGLGQFDLVTGTPPYFPVKQTMCSPADGESARCLFEFLGGIEDYCSAAASVLDPEGLFVVVWTSLTRARAYAGARNAGLRILAVLDTIPKTGKPSRFSVFVMCHEKASFQFAGNDSLFVPDRNPYFLPEESFRFESTEDSFKASEVLKSTCCSLAPHLENARLEERCGTDAGRSTEAGRTHPERANTDEKDSCASGGRSKLSEEAEKSSCTMAMPLPCHPTAFHPIPPYPSRTSGLQCDQTITVLSQSEAKDNGLRMLPSASHPHLSLPSESCACSSRHLDSILPERMAQESLLHMPQRSHSGKIESDQSVDLNFVDTFVDTQVPVSDSVNSGGVDLVLPWKMLDDVPVAEIVVRTSTGDRTDVYKRLLSVMGMPS